MIVDETHAREFCEQRASALSMGDLDKFVFLLRQENSRQNLVSAGSLEFVWQRHIADSMQLLDFVPRETSPWLDVGTGAGMPGLVLAIARPEMHFHLVESRTRRIAWLQSVVDDLKLTNCTIHGKRLETVSSFPVAVISARAFAPLGKLLHLSARFSTPDTVWLLPKGRSARHELNEQTAETKKMFHVEQSTTDEGAGILIGHGRPPLR